jgi:predicted permease
MYPVGIDFALPFTIEGQAAPTNGEEPRADIRMATPGYFETMKIPFLEGRDFTVMDLKKDATVAIVNRQFAEHFFPGRSAVGKHIGFGGGPKTKLNIEIIGVVANSLYEGPREGVHRQAFVPNWGNNSAAFYVRMHTASSAAYSVIRNEVKQLDSAMPVYEMKTLESQLDETLLTDRLIALLSAGFGLLATVLASVGLYGVMAFVVARRRKELGIRLALGAQPGFVIWLVMREVLVLVGSGVMLGLAAAWALNRLVSSQLYGVTANDPATIAGAAAILGLVALVAGYLPARRATRVNPVLALRYE